MNSTLPPSRPCPLGVPRALADPAPRLLVVGEYAVLLGLVATMLALVLGHRYLPMNDEPSHAANAVITLGLWRGDPFFGAHYQLQSAPLPYWAVALLMAPLQSLMTPLLAFRVVVALYVVLLPLSFLAVLRATGSDKNRPLTSLAALMAMSLAYFLGEVNYFFGQPLVLLAVALFVRPFPLRSLRLGGFVLLAAAVYLCHIYALTALCGALLGYVLQRLLTHKRPLLSAGQWAAAGWALLLFCGGAYFVLFAHGTDANSGGHFAFDFSPRKAAHLLIDPFDSPTPPSRPVLLAGVLGLLSLLLAPYLAAFGRSPRAALAAALRRPLLVPALLLLFVAFVGPVGLMPSSGRWVL
jgi:hypothetical protein